MEYRAIDQVYSCGVYRLGPRLHVSLFGPRESCLRRRHGTMLTQPPIVVRFCLYCAFRDAYCARQLPRDKMGNDVV